ncbi:MAG: hypothetical protein LBQ13_01090 [Endomicrobium sp.]|nr:hypothetical protein [Endomicrobium sp.]
MFQTAIIYSVKVHGEEIEKEIPKAVKYLNANCKDLDALLVGRDGDSVKVLWAFNTKFCSDGNFL